MSEQVVVTRNEDDHRWEARIGDALAGFAAYQQTDELVVFTHTEVEPAFEGRGVGGALARHTGALSAARGGCDSASLVEDAETAVAPGCAIARNGG